MTATKTSWMTRFWKGFVGIALLKLETYLIGVVLAGIVIFAGGAFLFGRIEDSNRRQRVSAEQEAADKVYNAAVVQWQRAEDTYTACLTRVEDQGKSRDALRGLFFAFADLTDVLPGSPGAELYTANRRALVNAMFEPIDVPAVQAEQCLPPGPAPVDPTPS